MKESVVQASSPLEKPACQARSSSHMHSWDRFGIFLSGLCAIHCFLTPLVALAVPVLGRTFEQPWVHAVMATLILPIGFFAFWSGHKHHRQTRVLLLGFAGLFLVTAALLSPFSWSHQLGPDLMTLAGSGLLIAAHLLNRRACRGH